MDVSVTAAIRKGCASGSAGPIIELRTSGWRMAKKRNLPRTLSEDLDRTSLSIHTSHYPGSPLSTGMVIGMVMPSLGALPVSMNP